MDTNKGRPAVDHWMVIFQPAHGSPTRLYRVTAHVNAATLEAAVDQARKELGFVSDSWSVWRVAPVLQEPS